VADVLEHEAIADLLWTQDRRERLLWMLTLL
jgi:hypothetical protein